jgi:hypothetical protein
LCFQKDILFTSSNYLCPSCILYCLIDWLYRSELNLRHFLLSYRAETWDLSFLPVSMHFSVLSYAHKHQCSMCECDFERLYRDFTLHPIELKLGVCVEHDMICIIRKFQLTNTHTNTNTVIRECNFERFYTTFCGQSEWNSVNVSYMSRLTNTHTCAHTQMGICILSRFPNFLGLNVGADF